MSIFLTEKTQKGPVEEDGLDTADSAGCAGRLAEIDTAKLRRLDVSSQLCRGLGLSVATLTEAEAGLDPRSDVVPVAAGVHAARHEAANSVLRVAVQLDAAGEGRCDRALANLCGKTKLGHKLTVGIHGRAQARPKGQVTVVVEEAVGGREATRRHQPAARQRVLKVLVLVKGGQAEAGQETGLGRRQGGRILRHWGTGY